MLSLFTYCLAFCLFIGAGFAKGIIGFGVNVICIPVMALILGGPHGARDAIGMVSIVTFLNNVILVFQLKTEDSWPQIRRIIPMLALGICGVVGGSLLLVVLDPRIITLLLGSITVLYVLTDKARRNWYINPQHEKIAAPVAGLASGFLQGISGVPTPLLVAYLTSLRLDRREFVYTISVIFIFYNGIQAASYWSLGLYRIEVLFFSLSFLIPVSIGTLIGAKVQARISHVVFSRLVLGALFLTGLDLIRRVIFS